MPPERLTPRTFNKGRTIRQIADTVLSGERSSVTLAAEFMLEILTFQNPAFVANAPETNGWKEWCQSVHDSARRAYAIYHLVDRDITDDEVAKERFCSGVICGMLYAELCRNWEKNWSSKDKKEIRRLLRIAEANERSLAAANAARKPDSNGKQAKAIAKMKELHADNPHLSKTDIIRQMSEIKQGGESVYGSYGAVRNYCLNVPNWRQKNQRGRK